MNSIPELFLLPGELIISKAERVLSYSAMGESKSGTSGVLYSTNFRVSFITAGAEPETSLMSVFQSNPDLTESSAATGIENDIRIPQTCISEIYGENGDKTKKLIPGSPVKSSYDNIIINCKDFRSVKFGFKFTPPEQQRMMLNAILHHAYPSSPRLLFAFDHSIAVMKLLNQDALLDVVPSFRNEWDWKNELSRLHGDNTWKITTVNKGFQVSQSLPRYFVCPSSLTEATLSMATNHYNDGRLPFWCWSHPENRAAVLCSAVGRPDSVMLEKQETILFKAVKTACLSEAEVKVLDLTKGWPSTQDLQTSFLKMKEVCCKRTSKQFWNSDSHWLAILDGTRWLTHIRTSLAAALDAAKSVWESRRPVIIRDWTGRDLSLVVASLTQLLCDPHCRTIRGFQALVQKVWVVGGHQFSQRCGHIKPAQKAEEKEEDQKSPVFLHFLDCVFQLLYQYPSEFEFSETFLIGLVDCSYSCMFDTFLFDSEYARFQLCENGEEKVRLVSLWDFIAEHLDTEDSGVFMNPLYEFRSCSKPVSPTSTPIKTAAKASFLECNVSAPAMRFWTGCYLRWMPVLRVSSGMGDSSAMHLQQMVLLNEVKYLKHKVAVLQCESSEAVLQSSGYPADDDIFGDDGLISTGMDFRASILSSLSQPFNFSDFSLNKYFTSSLEEKPDKDHSDTRM